MRQLDILKLTQKVRISVLRKFQCVPILYYIRANRVRGICAVKVNNFFILNQAAFCAQRQHLYTKLIYQGKHNKEWVCLVLQHGLIFFEPINNDSQLSRLKATKMIIDTGECFEQVNYML